MYLNVANVHCDILSSEPAIRLLGSETTDTNSKDIQLSSTDNIYWISISNDTSEVGQKIDKWNSHREGICEELYSAMNGQYNRNRRIVLFERIMSKYESEKIVVKPEANNANQLDQKYVPKIERNQELRGQSWAIIGIIGDASYEKSKSFIMERLANMYIEHMCTTLEILDVPTNLSPEEDSLIVAYFENDNIDTHDKLFLKSIESDLVDISFLHNEPLVSVWAISDDPDSLNEKSKKISEVASMKHADVAVVSMYSWLFLESWKKFKVRRTSKDPRAQNFFKIMRDNQE